MSGDTRRCPFCDELIRTNAVKCKHCGSTSRYRWSSTRGFAAKANLADIKALNVGDVVFSKRRRLEASDMARSNWVYKCLVRFRAGIEAGISFFKRSFWLPRTLLYPA